jgi:hypothetical protein
MSDILKFVRDHHAQIAYSATTALAALNLVITFALRIMPLDGWVVFAERNPRVAALVRLLGALGIMPVPVLQALLDIIRGTASPGTTAAAKALSVSSSKPVFSPPTPKSDRPTPRDPMKPPPPALIVSALFLLAMTACASLAQFESEVAAGDAILTPLVGGVCTVIGQVDPSKGATVTCDILDGAGNAIGQITTLEPPATVAKLIARHAKSGGAK